jgi:aminoglycoside phosphotransferase (APT) family kinase protein
VTRNTLDATHPLLRRLFTAMTEQQLSWVLLRFPEDLAAPSGDVDLLVAPADADALHHIARGLGFVALPGWDEGPNLILVSYDHASDRWLVLDVVTTIAFHATAERSRAAAEHVLDRRRFREGIAVPADEDGFWLLLAHCLLDKGSVPPRYRERLVELASAAAAPGAAAHAIGTPPSAFTTAVLERRWEELERLGRRLAGELRRRSPSERMRDMTRRTRAIAHRPLLLPRRMGVSVALLGPNGVGKSTVAAGLRRSFPFDARIVYMGLWSAEGVGVGVGATLGAAAARPLRIWRRHLLAQYHRCRGRLVVFDRYVYEAALPARPPLLALKRPYFWFLRHAVPAPDVAVVLDVPGPVAYGRKQENPPDELEAERLVYRGLADSVPSFELVDASRDPDAVRADVMALVWSAHAGRWRRPTRSSELRRAVRRSTRTRASALDRRALADACALVPRILDGESAAAGAVVADARLTATGTAILTLAREGEPPWAVVKLPSTEEGADALAHESETLALLQGDERLASLQSIVPRPLASGAVLAQPYRVDAHLGGRELVERLADPRRRRQMLEAAAGTIHGLHERTASTVVGDQRLAVRWVDARLDDLARAGAGLPGRLRPRIARLRGELHDAVIGRTFVTSWVHGDYWPGNVLFSADGTSVHGIVDWDAADPVDLPMHDLLHLLLYTRSLVQDEPLGQVVRRELRAPGLSPVERGILDDCGEWPPGGLPSYRLAVLLYWLRHVALHARQHARSADWAYRAWQARNVNAVLGAL